MSRKLTTDEKRKQRRKTTAEDFTPAWLVNNMLDKLKQYGAESFQEHRTFCDPACGNGNMLVEVLQCKLMLGHNPITALKTIYDCDLMKDNVDECRMRLLKIISKYTEITDDLIRIIFTNVVCRNSLEYDFSFKTIEHWKDILCKWRKRNVQDLYELSEMTDKEQEEKEEQLTLDNY